MTPYEYLYAVVSCGVKPWFDPLFGRGKAQGKMQEVVVEQVGVMDDEEKFAELGLSLLQSQQNVEIPETKLVVHLVLQRAVELVGSFFL